MPTLTAWSAPWWCKSAPETWPSVRPPAPSATLPLRVGSACPSPPPPPASRAEPSALPQPAPGAAKGLSYRPSHTQQAVLFTTPHDFVPAKANSHSRSRRCPQAGPSATRTDRPTDGLTDRPTDRPRPSGPPRRAQARTSWAARAVGARRERTLRPDWLLRPERCRRDPKGGGRSRRRSERPARPPAVSAHPLLLGAADGAVAGPFTRWRWRAVLRGARFGGSRPLPSPPPPPPTPSAPAARGAGARRPLRNRPLGHRHPRRLSAAAAAGKTGPLTDAGHLWERGVLPLGIISSSCRFLLETWVNQKVEQ